MSYYTYVVIAQNGRKTYTGSTCDLQRRILEHNQGKVAFSRKFRPFELLVCEKFDTVAQARQHEAFYKSTTGRRRLKALVDSWKKSRIANIDNGE